MSIIGFVDLHPDDLAGNTVTLKRFDFLDEVFARLKITETASGRVVFSHDYEQEYVAWSVGLVPIFSPLSAETVQADYIQNWCLSALTDRAIADATAFLSGAETSEKK